MLNDAQYNHKIIKKLLNRAQIQDPLKFFIF